MPAGSRLRAFSRRHRNLLIAAAVLLVVFILDYAVGGSVIWNTIAGGVAWLWAWFRDLPEPEPWLALVALTVFLAFANLYLKISLQAPNLQRWLRPAVFVNLPFAIYCSVYLLISVLAFIYLRDTVANPFVAAVGAALIGIGLGNADVKFGGFSLLPLAEFLQGLESVVQASIGVELSELAVAKQARLRDELAHLVPIETLERESLLLGLSEDKLREMQQRVGDDPETWAGLLAREIVKQSEANARRIIDAWS